ncbi:hypothetical protein SPLC1_S101520 [Arthrospira platensis C1]|nr:hypothetical protein SPLC1_S101520 [Arthrospira platensis C1]
MFYGVIDKFRRFYAIVIFLYKLSDRRRGQSPQNPLSPNLGKSVNLVMA